MAIAKHVRVHMFTVVWWKMAPSKENHPDSSKVKGLNFHW